MRELKLDGRVLVPSKFLDWVERAKVPDEYFGMLGIVSFDRARNKLAIRCCGQSINLKRMSIPFVPLRPQCLQS